MTEIGERTPDFCLPDQRGSNICLIDLLGRWTVIYFYPKDGTKGCTMEALDFTRNIERFSSLGADVLGISPDSVESHARFAERNGLRLTLLSDGTHEILERYGVWQLKKMYGREYHGVVRSTFLIDPKGKVADRWYNVKVKGHVENVLSSLTEKAKA
ncbi:MAG TPA: peroxiredoxin [Candidatus Methanofastidiosa archaeon]|nr:peroxiredoxin [Candidatus Methanofastidiosa archaeon]